MAEVFVSYLPACLAAVSAAGQKALYSAAFIGRNEVVQNLSGTRTGNRYKVPGTQTYYTASAPGQYPATATGNLKQSVKIRPDGDGYLVGTEVEYGLYLEKKPPNEGGREWLRPSLEKARPRMVAELSKRWV